MLELEPQESLAARIAALPKIHLHCHLEGTLRESTFLELTARDGLPTRYRPGAAAEEVDRSPREPGRVYAFADFPEFLLLFAAVSRALSRPEDYARLAEEFAADALRRGVAYGELFISPSVWRFFHPTLDLQACMAAIHEVFARVERSHGVAFRTIVDLTRNFGASSALETARFAASATELGVIGIGLGGDEARFPPELFVEAFAFARSEGLHAVVHAGEAAGAESVRSAVENLRAERIGHGIRAVENPAVIELLREREIPIEVCPTSNLRTGVVGAPEAHPLPELLAAGLRVAIDDDDPALFGAHIDDEYLEVARLVGESALRGCIATAIEASFAPASLKRSLEERLRSAE
ncbi:MAG: adenosine deaminase [Candidatus Eremiobacteraeota bacterium]|uniref:Putative adenosine deaminase n=1 Tax=mine drainage metagenome TaxID=410659 RepID=E6PIM7_9ZZZZ|nr:adenosine deaminase [Candidatus Eremiobacteraeota bacterium]